MYIVCVRVCGGKRIRSTLRTGAAGEESGKTMCETREKERDCSNRQFLVNFPKKKGKERTHTPGCLLWICSHICSPREGDLTPSGSVYPLVLSLQLHQQPPNRNCEFHETPSLDGGAYIFSALLCSKSCGRESSKFASGEAESSQLPFARKVEIRGASRLTINHTDTALYFLFDCWNSSKRPPRSADSPLSGSTLLFAITIGGTSLLPLGDLEWKFAFRGAELEVVWENPSPSHFFDFLLGDNNPVDKLRGKEFRIGSPLFGEGGFELFPVRFIRMAL